MCNCCWCSFVSLSGGLVYYLYNININTLFDDIDKFLVNKSEKKMIEFEPLKGDLSSSSDEEVVSQPYKNEYVFL